mmetsp:Transcript_1275/g.3553  ORF Transcript_1275/g.3553 Transcript_1275/m.3553 type:complete len:244 (+) Transcript_1275:1227-1958(+)
MHVPSCVHAAGIVGVGGASPSSPARSLHVARSARLRCAPAAIAACAPSPRDSVSRPQITCLLDECHSLTDPQAPKSHGGRNWNRLQSVCAPTASTPWKSPAAWAEDAPAESPSASALTGSLRHRGAASGPSFTRTTSVSGDSASSSSRPCTPPAYRVGARAARKTVPRLGSTENVPVDMVSVSSTRSSSMLSLVPRTAEKLNTTSDSAPKRGGCGHLVTSKFTSPASPRTSRMMKRGSKYRRA